MERIYVAVRPRPLSPEESESSPWMISGNSIFLTNQTSKFDFDRVFGEDCKTVDIFKSRTKEIVASVVQGFNGTVFAYGQTSSGKTYTMKGSAKEPGIIPLSVHELFCSIQEEMDREFLLRMSYMEIYNEEINDLLAPEHRKLQIHESLERGIYVAGLKEEIVNSPEQVLKLVEFGECHRHFGDTNMNLYSSRSHTIFRMIVESRERSIDGHSFNNFDAVRVSALNLVDLAGSERAGKTGAEGMRLKEGSHINKSLMTLGTVIKKLSDGVESLGGHVPYRDSKLTRILQPALGGNANTAMICNITLSQVHTDETKSTLQFASRALQVKNCACVNEILTDAALLKRQKKEIEELRTKLLSSHSEHLEEEILNLRNTLLQSELEKERIALELEEEKKAKAHHERRLLEQAKKIENLSSLILCSERDDRITHSMKRTRRLTWCPGPFQKKSLDKLLNLEAGIMEPIEDEQEISLLHPVSKLVQQREDVNNNHIRSCSSDNADYNDKMEIFSLPDAHVLLNVTSRRKNHQRRGQSVEMIPEFTDLYFESEAKIDSLEGNKTAVQLKLDDDFIVKTENNPSYKEKFEEDDYEKLENMPSEMKADISSLEEALEIMNGEKEEAFAKNANLSSELEAMTNNLNTAYFEIELLKEELVRMEQRVTDSESSSRVLERSLDSLSREKEEMILQLTEALLEVEAEKSGWTVKEKTLNEKLKRSNNEIVRLSEVIKELELCQGQCKNFGERLCPSEDIIKYEKNSSMSMYSEIGHLREEFNRLGVDSDGNQDEKSDLDLVSLQFHPACAQVHNLRSALLRVTGERERLLSKVDQLTSLEVQIEKLEGKYDDLQSKAEFFFQKLNQRVSSFEVEMQEDGDRKNMEISELRAKLSSTDAKLAACRRRLKEAFDERMVMDTKYREASTALKNQLRSYGQHILHLTKQLAEKS